MKPITFRFVSKDNRKLIIDSTTVFELLPVCVFSVGSMVHDPKISGNNLILQDGSRGNINLKRPMIPVMTYEGK